MADALSRSSLPTTGDSSTQSEVKTFIEAVTSTLPAAVPRLEAYRKCRQSDKVCSKVRQYWQEGWPERHLIEPDIRPLWNARASLTLHQALLLFNQRIVVPPALQKETLDKIHEGHQGIQRCRLRVRSSVWWPGVMNQQTQCVQNCSICLREAAATCEPLMLAPLPDYPWQVLGSDLFQL